MSTRSHPPSLRTLARRLIRDHRLLAKGDCALVAVSGGADSTALLHVLWLLREELSVSLVAAGIDHGLRTEAGQELAQVGTLAAALGIPFVVRKVHVAPGGNLQARARVQRHDALRSLAGQEGARVIATGHHADDRAETVLLRLLRGSGPRGLACLPPRQADLIRPLLLARRGDIDAHLARHRLPSSHDPSNDDARFLRTRVRHELLPLLTELSPGIVNHLTGLSDDLIPYVDEFPSEELRRAHREAARHAARRGKAGVRVRIAGVDRELSSTDGGRRIR